MGESISPEAKSKDILSKARPDSGLVFIIISGLIAFVFYFLTAFRTITWWDNGEYSLTALTLGIPHPPGSLLSIILGWLVTRLPLGISKIFLLNLFAGFMAAISLSLVLCIGIRIDRFHLSPGRNSRHNHRAIIYGLAALSGLSLGLGETLWTYGTKFTPYVLTAIFTGLIIWAMFRWWENAEIDSQFKWLFIIGLLFGLDFSVHRTNLLLLPGLMVWIMLANPGVLINLKSWLVGVGAFILGLSFHLITIPLALRKPLLNMNDPSSLSRFWDYITIKQYGGGMLLSILPRKGDFWSWQVPDFLHVFADNFLNFKNGLGIFGIVPFLLGIIGLITLLRKKFRLGIAMLALFVLTVAGTIIYFNVPQNFFRSMDRHYLPTLVIFSVWIVVGAAGFISAILRLKGTFRIAAFAIVVAIVTLIPIHQAIRNYRNVDGSRNYFAHDVSYNLLNTVAPDGILLVGGDNETWPLWYLQDIEGIRPDVTVINYSLMNTPWYMSQLLERHPNFPLVSEPAETDWNAARLWNDTVIAIPGDRNPAKYDLAINVDLPDTIQLSVKPAIAGKYILNADWLMIQIIKKNEWKRPIYFSVSLDPSILTWTRPYLRQEGAAYRMLPLQKPDIDFNILKNNLLEKYQFRSFSDYSVPMEDASIWAGRNYLNSFSALFMAEASSGKMDEFRKTITAMREKMPFDRLELPEEAQKQLENLYK